MSVKESLSLETRQESEHEFDKRERPLTFVFIPKQSYAISSFQLLSIGIAMDKKEGVK